MPNLPTEFLSTPITHRAYHDRSDGRPENSLAAVNAAIAAGYGIEIDVQRTADNRAAVFHDYDLERLTGRSGQIHDLSMAQAQETPLLGSDTQTIPSLRDVLERVAGRVPLLVEIKDQDGEMGRNVGPLEQAVADDIAGYDGPLAVMSFNPHSVEKMAEFAPDVPRGLTTCSYAQADWDLPAALRDRLRKIPDFDRVGASFISHYAPDLIRPRVQALRTSGVPVLCWTIRSAATEAEARNLCDNVTFEGYAAEIAP